MNAQQQQQFPKTRIDFKEFVQTDPTALLGNNNHSKKGYKVVEQVIIITVSDNEMGTIQLLDAHLMLIETSRGTAADE